MSLLLDHWHPILCSSALKDQPVGVRLCGKNMVLFRTGAGTIGALEDCCPHRRLRLSVGKVVQGRLQCAYHGWTFDCSGMGESPGTPRLSAQAPHFEASERHGAIWVKNCQSEAVFPPFAVDGYFHIGTLRHLAPAPLELVLDNFCEIEHTSTTHAVFGYPLERMQEVKVLFEPTEETVRVINTGPSKRLPLWMKFLLGITRKYQFNDTWTTFFAPVYSVYDHWWSHPQTQRESLVRWRLYIFFTPIDEQETAVLTFAYIRSRWPGPSGCVRPFRRLFRRKLDYEIQLDMRILENLADKNPSIEGMKLSRFDRVLGLNRERIERIYRGRPSSRLETETQRGQDL